MVYVRETPKEQSNLNNTTSVFIQISPRIRERQDQSQAPYAQVDSLPTKTLNLHPFFLLSSSVLPPLLPNMRMFLEIKSSHTVFHSDSI